MKRSCSKTYLSSVHEQAHPVMNVKRGIHKSMQNSCLPNRGTFPQPAGVKLAKDEVAGIHALSEKQRQSQGKVVKKIYSFPDGRKHRLLRRQGGYAKSEIITSSPYNSEVEMKQPTQIRKKSKKI
jgi:hypothetical protein